MAETSYTFSVNFFYNSICHVCKEYKGDKMKRCSSCKFITYCCKEHQINDWKNHKRICRLVANFNKYMSLGINCGYNKWRSYRTNLKLYLDHNLKSDLLPYENQMWMFPRACALCYSRENLMDCDICLCVAYCSVEHKSIHKEHHSLVCKDLKICLDYDRYHLKTKGIEIKLKEIHDDAKQLPDSIHECMQVIADMSKLCNSLDKIYVSETVAIMLTIIYGLEKCKILQNRRLNISDLVIHIVGADNLELMTDWKLNFILLNNWIKNLNSCKFIFIGPDCACDKLPVLDCDNIKIECLKDLYHNVKNIDDANLIIAFNSGLHEYECNVEQDTWKKSLEKLINDRAPLVITSYIRKELEEDLKRLKLFPMRVLLDISRNPYSSLRPIRDWDSEMCVPFYINGYIAILAGIHYHQ